MMRRFLGLIVFLCVGPLLVGGVEEPRKPAVESESSDTSDFSAFSLNQQEFKAVGSNRCTQNGCHGGGDLASHGTINGDEWDRWYDLGEGNHFLAYRHLESERSNKMAEILGARDGLGIKPQQRQDCLSCHAMNVRLDKREDTFRIDEGVSCEACHGRAQKWRDAHSYKEWAGLSAAEKAARGMYDTRNLIRRAELCASCHFGNEDRRVTHVMMAAGHPELPFEFATDLVGVPIHWRDEPCFLDKDEGPEFQARVWAVGQAVMLRESAERVVRWAKSTESVELAMFECYACHHALDFDTQEAGSRQKRGYMGTPGLPAWNAAPWAACRQLAYRLLALDRRARIDDDVAVLRTQFTLVVRDREVVSAAAADLAELADEMAQAAAEKRFHRQDVFELIRAIASDHEYIGRTGYRGAEQAWRAMVVLYRMTVMNSGELPSNHDEIVVTLGKLQDMLIKDRRNAHSWYKALAAEFDYVEFTDLMQKLAAQLQEGNASAIRAPSAERGRGAAYSRN